MLGLIEKISNTYFFYLTSFFISYLNFGIILATLTYISSADIHTKCLMIKSSMRNLVPIFPGGWYLVCLDVPVTVWIPKIITQIPVKTDEVGICNTSGSPSYHIPYIFQGYICGLHQGDRLKQVMVETPEKNPSFCSIFQEVIIICIDFYIIDTVNYLRGQFLLVTLDD